jgi:hypothetical protein
MFDDESTPFEVAQHVAESLREQLTKTHAPVVISPQDNRISLDGSGGRSLEIVVDGPNAFRVQDDLGNKSGGVQTQVTGGTARWSLTGRPCTEPEMVRRVKAWLSEQWTKMLCRPRGRAIAATDA